MAYGKIAPCVPWCSRSPGDRPFDSIFIGYLTMIVALTTVFLGIKRHRDRALGGVIRFLPAFGLGVAISLVASVFYVVSWEIVTAYGKFDFVAFYSNSMIEAARAKGPEAMRKAAEEVESFKSMYANRAIRMGLVFTEIFPVGLLISAISAAVLRNSRVLPARGDLTAS
jgi:hypothetical protein